ncbi:MAG TPA: PH domain-containing protein [Polyangiaceae bacterium]|jgi:hypothetical protein
MSRLSRPPGFEMTYRPQSSQAFGPPFVARVPSLVYLALALSLVAVVLIGSWSSHDSLLFRYVVEADAQRLVSARILAAIVLVSALASVLRARMRGVIVHPDGLEARDVLGFVGWPRVRRFAWPQIDRIVLNSGRLIGVDLWDGRRVWLPAVGKRDELAQTLERVAMARAIPVSGGTGLYDPPEREEGLVSNPEG